jgi:polysaccharide export outer membrane protein
MRVVLVLMLAVGLATSAAGQTLKSGDTIAISVYQDPKLDRQVVIGPSGTFSFPLAGRIQAQGLTLEALEKTLRAKLKDKYTVNPDVTVVLVAPAKPDDEARPKFYVTGQVTRPGPYVLSEGTNVMQAIAMSGGLAPFAAKSRIQIRRKVAGAESTLTFDYGAFESGSDLTGNVDLQPGDVVIVPEKGLFE